MIIDEILDTKEQQKFLNINYIKKEAEIFNFDNITKAINEQNTDELKTALKEYVTNNSYNKKFLNKMFHKLLIFLIVQFHNKIYLIFLLIILIYFAIKKVNTWY